MQSNPNVSFVLSSINRPESCLDTLNSIVSSSMTDFECVIVSHISCAREYKQKVESVFHGDIRFHFFYLDLPFFDPKNSDMSNFESQKYATPVTFWNYGATMTYGKWIFPISDDIIFENPIPKGITSSVLFDTAEENQHDTRHYMIRRDKYSQIGYLFHPVYIHSKAGNDVWMEISCRGMSFSSARLFSHNSPKYDYNIDYDKTRYNLYNKALIEYDSIAFSNRIKSIIHEIGVDAFERDTSSTIPIPYEFRSDINSFVDEILASVKEATPSLFIAQPKRKDEDEPVQDLVKGDQVRFPFGFNTKYATVSGMPVDIARNLLIDKAIDLDAKYLLFVDDDVALPRDGIINLIQTSEHLGNDAVVGGVCCLKGTQNPAISTIDTGGRLYTPDCMPNDEPLEITWATGCACLLIPVSVFKKMREKYPKMPFCLFAKKDGKRVVGEDIFLCARILKSGFKIFIDRNVQCLHFNMDTQEYTSLIYVDESRYVTRFKNIKRVK